MTAIKKSPEVMDLKIGKWLFFPRPKEDDLHVYRHRMDARMSHIRKTTELRLSVVIDPERDGVWVTRTA